MNYVKIHKNKFNSNDNENNILNDIKIYFFKNDLKASNYYIKENFENYNLQIEKYNYIFISLEEYLKYNENINEIRKQEKINKKKLNSINKLNKINKNVSENSSIQLSFSNLNDFHSNEENNHSENNRSVTYSFRNINKINYNISNLKNKNDNYIYSDSNLNYQMVKCENLQILGYENQYQNNSNSTIQELNNIIQNLLLKMEEMKEIIDNYITQKNYLNNNNLMLESNSIFFISDKSLNKEVNNKNAYIENTKREQEMLNLQNKTNLLSLENQTLIERIKILERKISNQTQNNINNNINKNENIENNNFECENNNEITLNLPNNVISNQEENIFPSQFYSKDNSPKQSISIEDETNYKSNNNNKFNRLKTK
jgi:hypothetical protein